ncbi:MAG: hypothetical protein GY930_20785, partial [bacterium]|nr:hypothetical protein [bacterium]
MGADGVLHSLTKHPGDHSDAVTGVLIVNEQKLAERTGPLPKLRRRHPR